MIARGPAAAGTERHECRDGGECCDGCGADAPTKLCANCGVARYCSRECQLAAWPTHKWTCSAAVHVCADEAARCGARLVARKPFAEGDEILRERPLARLSVANVRMPASQSKETAHARGELLWQKHVDAMDDTPERRIILRLKDSWHETPTAGGIGRTNAVPLGDENDCEGHALFALICRANHSCFCNARYIWRHDLQRELLIAVRPIAPGDEITVTYLAVFASRDARRKTLREDFRFECACERCAAGDDAAEAALQEAGELEEAIPSVAQLQPERAIRMAKRALSLLEKAGMGTALWGKRLKHDLHQIYAKIGQPRLANVWYQQAMAAALTCEGGNDPGGVRLPRY